MILKVLIVPDKFKGTLTAQAAAAAIAEGWRTARAGDSLELLPMSDGGDGFGEVLNALLSAETRTVETVDAVHVPRRANWWWQRETKTAIIESAQVIGLAFLPTGKFHPFDLDTFGLGAVLKAAVESGARRCLVGIGGSATNDGGFGMARSLGWSFLGKGGQPIERWVQLDSLEKILPPPSVPGSPFPARPGSSEFEVLVAVDVQNPLLGPVGATRVYGPQKGLRAEDMFPAESCLERLQQVCGRDFQLAPLSAPGDGAAGGLGFGLRCFVQARLESGFRLFARYAKLEERIRAAQLVITGEGAIDASTVMGKGVGEIANLCKKNSVPCLGLAGTLVAEASAGVGAGSFTRVYGITPELTDVNQAKCDAGIWLSRLAARAAKSWE